jgi:hypothetical protein
MSKTLRSLNRRRIAAVLRFFELKHVVAARAQRRRAAATFSLFAVVFTFLISISY